VKKHIPNFFTCLNLFSGCIAVVMISRGDREHFKYLEYASVLVFAAAFFDFCDGMAARVLNVHSAMGKELDSLADVVTFGLVPGAVMYRLLEMSDPAMISISENFHRVFQFFPFIITIFSALRLANFNVDTRQSESFIGVPTPANTLLVVSLPLILMHDQFHLTGLILNPFFITILCIVLSYLLVADLPLFALKFKSFEWKKNSYQYILLISSLILLALFLYVAIPLIILLYILLSFIKNISRTSAKTPIPPYQ